MNAHRRLILALSCAGVLYFAPISLHADWPNFLGPNHNGVSGEKGFRTQWDSAIPMVWQKDIGSAFSSFAIAGNRLFTCGTAGKKQVLYALNADTGEILWQNPFEDDFRNEHGDGTRATPTFHDGRVYVLGALGRLICADAENGSIIWEKSFHNKPKWAYSGSVLIEGDLAVVSAGKGDGALVAFDRKTGQQIWKTGNDPVGYATPYPFTFNGQRYIVGFLGNAAMIVEAKTGREVWRTEWKTDYEVNAAMPIVHDGHLFITSGYRKGAGLFKLAADGDKLSASSVWQSDVLLTKFQSCILHDGKLYASDQNAMKCVDFMTGKELWSKPRVRNGTMILADGNLIFLTEGGQLQIGKPSPEGFNLTTTADILDGRCWSVPVLLNGKLYARNLERVVCFNLRG